MNVLLVTTPVIQLKNVVTFLVVISASIPVQRDLPSHMMVLVLILTNVGQQMNANTTKSASTCPEDTPVPAHVAIAQQDQTYPVLILTSVRSWYIVSTAARTHLEASGAPVHQATDLLLTNEHVKISMNAPR